MGDRPFNPARLFSLMLKQVSMYTTPIVLNRQLASGATPPPPPYTPLIVAYLHNIIVQYMSIGSMFVQSLLGMNSPSISNGPQTMI